MPEKVDIHGYVDSRLRDVIIAMADAEDVALSEIIARLLAKAVDRPDLAEVPRKRMGRPRKAKEGLPAKSKKNKRKGLI